MKKKKIILINPPSPFLISERVFPNLGLVQLATSLRGKGLETEILDLCGNKEPEEEIKAIANQSNFFGFSSTSPQFGQTFRLNRILKRTNPQARSILGGAHASAMYSFMRRQKQENPLDDENIPPLFEFDKIVVGEGDLHPEVFSESGEKIFVTKPIKNLDDLPFPDRSLIDIHSYRYVIQGLDAPATTIMTQRGCPFRCSFCCGRDIPMYSHARSRSPEKVLEELDYLSREFGFTSFMWFDDELNLDPKRVMELSKLLKTRDYTHRGFVRSDLVLKHPETIDALQQAGFVELCSGFEFGSKRMLEVTRKGTTPEQNAQAARMIMNKGLRYKCFGMIGGPGETYENVIETKRWLQEVNPDGFDITILSPYPGSKIYDEAVPSRKYKGFDQEWNGLYFRKPNFAQDSTFYKGIPGEYSCNIRTDELEPETILKLRDEIEIELKKEK